MIKAIRSTQIDIYFKCDFCGLEKTFKSSLYSPREAERDTLNKQHYIATRDGKTYCCKDCYNKSKKGKRQVRVGSKKN